MLCCHLSIWCVHSNKSSKTTLETILKSGTQEQRTMEAEADELSRLILGNLVHGHSGSNDNRVHVRYAD